MLQYVYCVTSPQCVPSLSLVCCIILQIRVGNTPIFVLNFIILLKSMCIVLQVPSVYLALGITLINSFDS